MQGSSPPDVEQQPLQQNKDKPSYYSSILPTPFHRHSTRRTATLSEPKSTMSRVLKLSLCTTLLLVLLVVHLPGVLPSPLGIDSDLIGPSRQHGRSRSSEADSGKRGAVASESHICSRHGTDIILKGGNAADAMVATMLCVGVVGMYHSGIGGGGFMLVKSPAGEFEYIDFRETAPAAAFEEMFNNTTDSSTLGGLASGVPGELRGLEYLHKKYGSLPWSVLVQPAIDTARNGFLVGKDLVKYMDSAIGDSEDFLVNDPSWAVDFAPNGTRVKLGDTLTRKRYASTLETIASQGPDAFYSGPIAESTIKALKAANGIMTLEDLRNYTAVVRDYSQIDYRGYKVTSTTTPSSGSVALNMLKVLDTYETLFTPQNVNLSTHRMDEAMRFGYGLRTVLGDPGFVEGMSEYEKAMLEQSTITEIHNKIFDQRTQNVSAYDPAGYESLDTPGTSHIATTDASGLSISAITTINLLFGNRIVVPETGIILNNEMDDFSIPGSSNYFGYIPSESNYIRPGKRPLSSCTPAIVTHPNGTTFFIAGSAGGSRIITATVQNIIHAVDEKLSAAEVLARPRLHDQLVPNQVSFEYDFDNATVAFMKGRGHNVTWMAPGTSTAQAIRVLPNGTFDAAGEPRQLDSGGFAV
ncbi:gamma-glutamyltransferase [Aspergillus undulatus]|uniref:gamma-glutamyltransferase n=1 Tax=Aspergillus undulatus TaxID=1810928 RepID=UPI003CCCDEB3